MKLYTTMAVVAIVVGLPNTSHAASGKDYGDGIWTIELSHEDVEKLKKGEGIVGPSLPPQAQAICKLVVTLVAVVDKAGGNKGVTLITGPEPYAHLVVPNGNAPAVLNLLGSPAFRKLIKETGDRIPISFVTGLIHGKPDVNNFFKDMTPPDPVGRAIFSAIWDIFHNKQADRPVGRLEVNRAIPHEWESIVMATAPMKEKVAGDFVALHFATGYLSGQQPGEQDTNGVVIANREIAGAWELWEMIQNSDGTVSFRMNLKDRNKHRYLTVSELKFNKGKLKDVQAPLNTWGTTIGDYQKFDLTVLPGGFVALKSHKTGKYVSSQP